MTDRRRPDRPRLEPLDPGSLDEETRRHVPDGALNIFRTLARHPKLLKRWLVFGAHVLAKNTIPPRERELAILRTAWRCRAEYEFGHHVGIASREGVRDDEIVAVTRDLDAHDWSTADRDLLQAVDELHEDQCITDQTWSSLAVVWNEQQLLDLVFTVGQYTLVSMALNSCGVQREEGVPGFGDLTTSPLR